MSESTEKRYLKWYNKIGYGSGDIAGNVVYAFLSSFVMIYLTNTVGLDPGIVGTLIAVSKLLDGVTDVFFGSLIDKTHSKLGKARPWMLYGYIGCAVTLVAIFAIPESLGQFAQYAWFLIAYTLLNAVFYTANNIAYSALTALVTKNSAEQVEMGSYRFMFAFATSLLIQSITLGGVTALGGGVQGWRTIAIIYAIIGLIVNTVSVFSVKELPESKLVNTNDKNEIAKDEKYNLIEAAKLLGSNKYYMMICVTYILQQIYTAMIGMGTYYAIYIFGNENLFGVFSWAINIPLILALIFTPMLVAKWHGMYKLNVMSYGLATISRALVAVAGFMGASGNVGLMLLFTAIAAVLSVVAGLRSKSFTLGCLSFAGCCVALTALFLLKSSWLTEAFSAVLSALCLFTPFEEFVNSSFSIPTLVYYLTVAAVFLFFTAQGLEKRRWN